MKNKKTYTLILTPLFILTSLTTVCQTPTHTHNNFGTRDSNPHYSTPRLINQVHNSFNYSIDRNPHFSGYVDSGLVHNSANHSVDRNPHYTKYVDPDKKHNSIGHSVDINPHYTTFVDPKKNHNYVGYSIDINPHYTSFVDPDKIHYSFGGSVDENPNYSTFFDPSADPSFNSGAKDSKRNEKNSINDQGFQTGLIEIVPYPNPALSEITIPDVHIPRFVTNTKIEVFSLYGKNVLTETIYNNGDSSYQLDISNIEKGTYIIRVIMDDKQILHGKFIKK